MLTGRKEAINTQNQNLFLLEAFYRRRKRRKKEKSMCSVDVDPYPGGSPSCNLSPSISSVNSRESCHLYCVLCAFAHNEVLK
ncbi:hypothetical protein OWV82_020710 [Melia azedarach]|uniref:Uncharacterized protein n=1 Tax=Melia azedarach TaxID=155640 RepID=A0ACC1X741_MELAZ|nr:hypothetical protein OWV82_020710 [Melia azedarach]